MVSILYHRDDVGIYASVYAFSWRYGPRIGGQRLEVNRPVVETRPAIFIHSAIAVLEPPLVVSVRMILPGMRATTLGPRESRG